MLKQIPHRLATSFQPRRKPPNVGPQGPHFAPRTTLPLVNNVVHPPARPNLIVHPQPVPVVAMQPVPVAHHALVTRPSTLIVHTSKEDTETKSLIARVGIKLVLLAISISITSLLFVKRRLYPMHLPLKILYGVMVVITGLFFAESIYSIYGFFSSQNNNKEASNDTSTVASDQKNAQENMTTNSEDNQYKPTESTTDGVPSKILTDDGMQSSTQQNMARG